jgi:hypothetical protein
VKVVARFWTFAALASLFLLLLFFLLLPFFFFLFLLLLFFLLLFLLLFLLFFYFLLLFFVLYFNPLVFCNIKCCAVVSPPHNCVLYKGLAYIFASLT